MKGTMIGLAPPGLGSTGAPGGAPAEPAPIAGGQQAPAPAGPAQGPSKLKGTMIGVAPPSLGGSANPGPLPGSGGQGAADGTAATMVMPSHAPLAGSGLGAGAPGAGPSGAASPAMARTEVIPSVGGVNPLSGTVIGGPAPDFTGVGASAQIPSGQIPSGQIPSGTAPHAQAPAAPGAGSQAFAQTTLSQAVTPPGTGAVAAGQSPTGERPAGGLALGGPEYTAPAGAAAPGALAVAPTGARGPLGKARNPVATLLIGMMCFVYALVVYIQMLGELKRFRQKSDISLLLFFIPIINILEVLKLPEKVADAQRMAGVQAPQVAHPVLYLFFGLYFFPADLNEVWEAARRNAG